jgi:diguanylate cyclase (GGDEF)-like protein
VVSGDGRFVEVGVSVTPSFGDDGELSAVAVLAQDISDRRFFESVLAHRAMHDPLTGLANSTALLERIAAELDRPNRSPGELAVVFIDLDNFKLVNDSLGHDRGDQLLLAITSRLRSTVRSGDLLARIGADEFVAVLPMPDGLTRARAVAERVTRIVSVPIQIDSRKVYVAASVGISIDDDPTDRTPASLLRNAELAMHEAKQRGRNRVEVFDASLRKAARARLELETELHQAIERGELAVAYQPVFDLTDRHLTGFEALVRWRHPLRGELTPADFVDVASESSLISETDSVVLDLACADLAAWTERFGRRRELGVAVNVSPRQLARDDLPDLIAATISRHGLAPEQLTLEIIEGQLMDDVPATLATLDRLRALGIGLAIDDFGTGHSSLGYLRQFDVDVLKIDKSFVSTLGTDETSHVIIDAMIQLADTFGYATVAEGVEDQAQLDALTELGCRRAQGFLLGRPLPAAEVGDFLEHSLAAT